MKKKAYRWFYVHPEIESVYVLHTNKGGTIYQPLRSGRIWHKVNFLSGV